MEKNKIEFVNFTFDKDRRSSLVLVINKGEGISDFEPSKFLKKYYSINTSKDEGETQSYSYLDSLGTIKKIKGKFTFGYDFVIIKAKNISQIIEILFNKNFGEIWVTIGDKYQCIADLNSQSEEEVKMSISQIFTENKIEASGIIFEVVAF